jgi:hypothetical protein
MALVRTRRELACLFKRCAAARRTTLRYAAFKMGGRALNDLAGSGYGAHLLDALASLIAKRARGKPTA